MFLVTWLFDKLGYMPKISVETTWPFPATQQDYVAPEFEKPISKQAKKAKVVAKMATKKPNRKKKA